MLAHGASLAERRVVPSLNECGAWTLGDPVMMSADNRDISTAPFSMVKTADINIWMKCAKKPLSQKGAYLVVRDRIAEGALTKQFADLPQPKIGDFRPGTPTRRQRITAIFGCRTRKHPSFGEARTMSYVTNRKRGADKVVRQRRGKRHPIQGHTQLTSIFG